MARAKYFMECEACGNGFDSNRAHAKYCSPKCRKRGSRVNDGYTLEAYHKVKTCQVCGKIIDVKQPHQPHMFCSNACKQKDYRRRKAES